MKEVKSVVVLEFTPFSGDVVQISPTKEEEVKKIKLFWEMVVQYFTTFAYDGSQKVRMIKMARNALGFNLKVSKALVEDAIIIAQPDGMPIYY